LRRYKISGYSDEQDIVFVLLMLLQEGASAYYSDVFTSKYAIDFGNVHESSLEDCLFIYYRNGKAYGNIFEDPLETLFTHYLIANKKF